jgi:Mg-chelatase subunit ChlD
MASLALHTGILAVFTGVQLSQGGQEARPERSVAAMQAIERVTEQPKPVPRVKPIEIPPVPVDEPEPVLVKKARPEPAAEWRAPVEAAETTAAPATVQAAACEVEFFGQRSAVQQVCYVVDCTGSMHGRMYLVKEQLRQSILKLTSDQAFSIVFFRSGDQVLLSGSGRLERATASSKSAALNLIQSVRPEGTADVLHALETAMRLKGPDGRGAEAFYFLTDGFDLDSTGWQGFVKNVHTLRRKLAPRAALHTIGFSPLALDRRMLQTLAQSTGGDYVEVE